MIRTQNNFNPAFVLPCNLLITMSAGRAMNGDPSRLGFGMILGKALEFFTGQEASLGGIKVLINVK